MLLRRFHISYVKDATCGATACDAVEVILGVLRDQNASNKERMETATWLDDRGYGNPAPVRDDNPSGIGDFTIVIGDHDARGNPINDLSRDCGL